MKIGSKNQKVREIRFELSGGSQNLGFKKSDATVLYVASYIKINHYCIPSGSYSKSIPRLGSTAGVSPGITVGSGFTPNKIKSRCSPRGKGKIKMYLLLPTQSKIVLSAPGNVQGCNSCSQTNVTLACAMPPALAQLALSSCTAKSNK